VSTRGATSKIPNVRNRRAEIRPRNRSTPRQCLSGRGLRSENGMWKAIRRVHQPYPSLAQRPGGLHLAMSCMIRLAAQAPGYDDEVNQAGWSCDLKIWPHRPLGRPIARGCFSIIPQRSP